MKFPEWNEIENQLKQNFSEQGFDDDSISEMISDYKIKFEKWNENRVVSVFLHESHFQIGKRFPQLAFFMLKIIK